MYDSLNTGLLMPWWMMSLVLKYSIGVKGKIENTTVGTPIGETALRLKKNNPELIQMFNNGLANL